MVDHVELGPLGAELRAVVEVELGRKLLVGGAPASREALEAEVERLGLELAVAVCLDAARRVRAARGEAVEAMAYFLGPLQDARPTPGEGGAAEPPPDPSDAGRVLARIRDQLRPDLFAKWYAPLRGERENGVLRFIAPNEFHARFLGDEHLVWIRKVATEVLGEAVEVQVAGGAP